MAKGTRTALRVVQLFYPQVTKVADANTDLEVGVNRKDCTDALKSMRRQKGKEKLASSLTECAMARAIGREHEGAVVSRSVTYVVDGRMATRYRNSSDLFRELSALDRIDSFIPGFYRLNAPSPSKQLQPLGRKLYNQKSRNLYGKTKKRHMISGVRSLNSPGLSSYVQG